MVKGVIGLVAALTAALAFSSVGCGDDTGGAGGGGTVDCTDVKGYSELGSAFSKCINCHSSDLKSPGERQSAPVGFDYETYDLAKTHPVEITEQVEDDAMPPAGSPPLTDQEKADLLKWAACDTPE